MIESQHVQLHVSPLDTAHAPIKQEGNYIKVCKQKTIVVNNIVSIECLKVANSSAELCEGLTHGGMVE